MKFRLFGRDSTKNVGGQNELSISIRGEALVRAFDYSDFESLTLNVIDTAFNFTKFGPKTGFQLVITGGIISGNRDIGPNGSIMSVYTAATETETTALDTAIDVEVPKSTVLPFVVPNVIIAENVFLNAKCDDDVVRVGLYGYFVPKT